VTDRLASLPKAAQVALVATGLLLVALVGYFTLISPKRSTAAGLKKQTAAVQAEINSNRSSAFTQALPAVRAASVFSVSQAMPKTLDTPDVLISLNQLALSSGISFDQITPQGSGSSSSSTSTSAASGVATTTTSDPFAVEPIQAKFTGSYYNLLTFLQRLRNQVRVQNGKLFTAGRLFDVSSVDLAAGSQGFPQISATLTINEFVPQTTAPAAVSGTTDTTSTTTTATTTTSGTSAAPSSSGGTS
jgi:Tfp pilus assembly protein PilO